MNSTMFIYATAAVILLMVWQASAASLINGANQQQDTDEMDITTGAPGTIEEDIRLHQDAIKWLRVYKYMPQDNSIDCEICLPEKCPTECLQILKDLAVEPLTEFQKFYKFDTTGILTQEEINQMKEPRCGDTDEKPGSDLGKGGRTKRWAKLGSTVWPADMMPLKISVNGGVRGFDVRAVEDIALKCARLWAEPSSLYFQLAARGSKGNIDVRFEHIDGPWNTVGLGLSPVIWGDKSSYLKLDSSETWKKNAKTNGYGVSLTWAICHEMGHNLGLSHSSDRKALMYPSGVGQDEDTLPRDDYNGITSLYRGRNGKTTFGRAPAPGPPPRPTPPARRVTTRRPPTTRRPTQQRTRAPTRPRTRPPPTRAPTRNRTTPYRRYKPTGRNFAPPGHQPRYRPASPTASTRAPSPPTNYWYFDADENRWVYG